MRTVVALGGNALSPAAGEGAVEEMRAVLGGTSAALAALVADGRSLVLTHGNGPQIGRILLQQQAAAGQVPPMPMDVCGAQSQGQLGYLLAQALDNALRQAGTPARVLCLVTQVVVEPDDPAFAHPDKAVGPAYDEETAATLARTTGTHFARQPDGRWRRVVASPLPVRLVEEGPLRDLADRGHVVVAAGGGGVPVLDGPEGLVGVEAVVDKDRTAALLARAVNAEQLLILTDVDHVELGFGSARATPLDHLTVSEARAHLAAGEFAAGSMRPKVEACCDFVAGGGGEAVIGPLSRASEVATGRAGTVISTG